MSSLRDTTADAAAELQAQFARQPVGAPLTLSGAEADDLEGGISEAHALLARLLARNRKEFRQAREIEGVMARLHRLSRRIAKRVTADGGGG